MINLFVDLDGTLVDARTWEKEGYENLPWFPGGKELWNWVKWFRPTILSQLPDERLWAGANQKREWCKRELGEDVPVIVTPDSTGKLPYAVPGAYLIDDSKRHMEGWREAGGIFILHFSANATITALAKTLRCP